MTTYLYWIHHKSHTDIFSQGYVGVVEKENQVKNMNTLKNVCG